jgi:hypothetical protein
MLIREQLVTYALRGPAQKSHNFSTALIVSLESMTMTLSLKPVVRLVLKVDIQKTIVKVALARFALQANSMPCLGKRVSQLVSHAQVANMPVWLARRVEIVKRENLMRIWTQRRNVPSATTLRALCVRATTSHLSQAGT